MEKVFMVWKKTILAGRLKDRHKMERIVGKIQARHPQVNDLYDVVSGRRAEGVRLSWQMKDDRKRWRDIARRCLSTAPTAATARRVVVEVYAVDGGGSLPGIEERVDPPLFHQLEPRVKAHVMVAFLGYALWVTLKTFVEASASRRSFRSYSERGRQRPAALP